MRGRRLPELSTQEITPLTPTEAREILKRVDFVSGAPDVPGADIATRALRAELSEQFKRAVPGTRAIFEEESQLIPLRKTLDLALANPGPMVQSPEVILNANRGARLFGISRPGRATSFAAGKGLARGGRRLTSPLLPPAVRTSLLALRQALAEDELP